MLFYCGERINCSNAESSLTHLLFFLCVHTTLSCSFASVLCPHNHIKLWWRTVFRSEGLTKTTSKEDILVLCSSSKCSLRSTMMPVSALHHQRAPTALEARTSLRVSSVTGAFQKHSFRYGMIAFKIKAFHRIFIFKVN